MSINDVREFCRRFPDNAIAAAWQNMLDDGEHYNVWDFVVEADMQVVMGHISGTEIVEMALRKEEEDEVTTA